MSMKLAQKATYVLWIFAAMLLASCGGGGGGGGSPPPPPITDVAEQSTAHNDSTTAQTIPLLSRISGSLPISNFLSFAEYDWYRLVLSATTPVTMTLTGPAGPDIDLFLLAGDGTTQLAESIGLTSDESISQSLAAATYFIVVAPFDVMVASAYTLVVQ